MMHICSAIITKISDANQPIFPVIKNTQTKVVTPTVHCRVLSVKHAAFIRIVLGE